MNVLALEVGTSVVRAAVVDVATGTVRGEIATTPMTIDAPTPDSAELPAQRLWEALATSARAAVRQAGVAGKIEQDITGIGLSTFMPGLVLLGESDQPLAPIWTNLDRRARPAARQVWAHVGEEFHATIGSRPLPGLVSALMWRQQHSVDPYMSHRVRSYLHVNGWLAFHLTGVKAFDPANASATGLFGTLTDQAWTGRWCDYFEVDRAWLPAIVCGSATVGTLRAAVANELNVPAGIPVKLGTSELGATMLASRIEPGDALHLVGKTQTLATVTDTPRPGPRRLVHRLGVGPRFVNVASNPVGIEALTWLHQLCFRDQTEAEFYEKTIPLARDRETRISLDPPFLAGDPFEIEASRAALRDMELTSDRLDVLAALLDAMQSRHREAFSSLEITGPLRRVVLIGSGVERIRRLLPEYERCRIEPWNGDRLCGVARLFA